MNEIIPTLEENEKRCVFITHDESTFYCNEGRRMFWMENKKNKLLPKSKGRSIMISGFICPCHGFMSAPINGIVINSFRAFYARTNRQGWFTNQDFVDEISNYAPQFKLLNPNCEIVV